MSKKLKFIIVAVFCTAVLLIVIAIKTPDSPNAINQNPTSHTTPQTPLDTRLTHDIQKDCTHCHPPQKPEEPVSKEVKSENIHRICYQCHQDYSNLKGWVHGPVALGQCLVCHNFHYENNNFLKFPLPQLCYQCHDSQDMASVEKHSDPAYSNCNNCHLPHAGPEINRLKPKAI